MGSCYVLPGRRGVACSDPSSRCPRSSSLLLLSGTFISRRLCLPGAQGNGRAALPQAPRPPPGHVLPKLTSLAVKPRCSTTQRTRYSARSPGFPQPGPARLLSPWPSPTSGRRKHSRSGWPPEGLPFVTPASQRGRQNTCVRAPFLDSGYRL